MELCTLMFVISLCWSSTVAESEPQPSKPVTNLVRSILGGGTTITCRSSTLFTSSIHGCTTCSQCSYNQECCVSRNCYSCQAKTSISTFPSTGGIGVTGYVPSCQRYTGSSFYGCTDTCGQYNGCSNNQVCCNTGFCKRCEPRYGGGGGSGGSGYPTCVASTGIALSLGPACYDRCSLTQACGRGERCCWNGRCRKCEASYVAPKNNLPQCRVNGVGGYNTYCSSNQCTQYSGCGYTQRCCWDGNCNRCESKDIINPGGGYPKCVASTGIALSLGPACYDRCSLTQACGRGERCCWNGRCRKCEASYVAPTNNLPQCKAYRVGGYNTYCSSNECTRYSGCGYTERCCFDGKCNKCELRNTNTGEGLPRCQAPTISLSYTLVGCRDTCKDRDQCGSGYKCCWNGYCKTCEAHYGGGGGGGVPSCPYSSSQPSISIYCANECTRQTDCGSYRRCCNNGRCNKCISILTG